MKPILKFYINQNTSILQVFLDLFLLRCLHLNTSHIQAQQKVHK